MSDIKDSAHMMLSFADAMMEFITSGDIDMIGADMGMQAEISAVKESLTALQVKAHAIYCEQNGLVH